MNGQERGRGLSDMDLSRCLCLTIVKPMSGLFVGEQGYKG